MSESREPAGSSRVPWLIRSLLVPVPRNHHEPDSAFRRRRVIVAVTLVVGAVLLGLSLTTRPGAAAFYPLTAALALTWLVGGLLAGPLHVGFVESVSGSLQRPVLQPLLLGVLAAAVFVLGALVAREIGPVRHLVERVLEHADHGSLVLIALTTVANGVAEEVFFRGALYAAVGRRYPVVITTLIYTAVTLASGNVMLAFAAITVGLLFALERRSSGGVLASGITHVVWSMAMLFALPPLFR